MITPQSEKEAKRIRTLSAFNIKGYKTRKKINQHLAIYTFPDSSTLHIYAGKSKYNYSCKDLTKCGNVPNRINVIGI